MYSNVLLCPDPGLTFLYTNENKVSRAIAWELSPMVITKPGPLVVPKFKTFLLFLSLDCQEARETGLEEATNPPQY